MALQDSGIRLVVLGVTSFERDTNTARNALTSFERAAGGTASRLNQLGAGISRLGQLWTSAISVPLAVTGGALLASGIQFEDAFAGVAKTVEGVSDNFGKLTAQGEALRNQFRGLALNIPVSVNELARLGEQAGALGIQQGQLTEFVKTIAMLGVTTNLNAEDAGNAIARMGNIMGISADQMGTFAKQAGSALVDLGNKSAATESDIINMAYRISGAGKALGMSTQEILGLSTSVSELGINAEAGGTAVSRILLEMQSSLAEGGDKLAMFSKAAGMTTDEFKNLVRNSPIQAFYRVAGGLAAMQEQGVLTSDTLAGLGMNSVRLRDVINRFGPDMGNLTKNIDTANKAWQEGSALQIEAQKRFNTTKSQLILLKNAFVDLGITIFDLYAGPIKALVKGVRAVILGINAMNESALRNVVKIGAIVAAIGPLLIVLGFLIQLFASLSGYIRIGMLAFGALSVPMLAIGVAGVLVAANFDKIKEAVKNVTPALKDTAFWLKKAYDFGKKRFGTGNFLFGIGHALKALTYIYEDTKRTFFSNILKALGMGQEEAEKMGMSIRDKLAPSLTFLSGIFSTLGFWLNTFIEDIKTVGIAEAIANMFAMPEMAFNEDTMLRPIERIIMAFGVSRETIDKLRETFNTLTTQTLPALAAFAGSVIALFMDVAGFMRDNMLPILADVFFWIINDFVPALLPVLKDLADALKALWDDSKDDLKALLKWVKDEAFPKFANFITEDLLPALDDLIKRIKENSGVLGPLVLVLGLAWLAFTILSPVVTTAWAAFTLLKIGITGVTTVVGLLLGPLGLILLPLALGAALIYLYTTNTWGFKDAIDKIKPSLERWRDVWDSLKVIYSLIPGDLRKIIDLLAKFTIPGQLVMFRDILRDAAGYAKDIVGKLGLLNKDSADNAVRGGGGGQRGFGATGGPISGPMTVGERGRELFIPGQSGYIINNRLTQLLSSVLSTVALTRPTTQGSNMYNRSFAPTIYGAPISDQEQLTGDLGHMYRMATLANY